MKVPRVRRVRQVRWFRRVGRVATDGQGRETWFEVGLLLLAAGVAVGIGVLAFGRAAGGAHHSSGHSQPAPEAGSVPEHRHQHIATNAAR
jgi:hypothetical protein